VPPPASRHLLIADTCSFKKQPRREVCRDGSRHSPPVVPPGHPLTRLGFVNHPGILSQNPGFEFCLHGLMANVKAPNTGHSAHLIR